MSVNVEILSIGVTQGNKDVTFVVQKKLVFHVEYFVECLEH